MQYAEAFRALGYQLTSVRTDWTAINAGGVCASIWEKELGWKGGRPWYDTREHADPIEEWGWKPGSKKRVEHLGKSLADFDGFVDVVIVQGEPKEGVSNAHPWKPEERKGFRWRVTYLDPANGHCAFEVQAPAGD